MSGICEDNIEKSRMVSRHREQSADWIIVGRVVDYKSLAYLICDLRLSAPDFWKEV